MYRVEVFATPMSLPFNFTIHSWIEVTIGDTVTRYDLWGYPGITKKPIAGYIYQDIFPNHLGTTLSPFARVKDTHKRQVGHVIAEISGAENSLAAALATAITEQVALYPYANKYRMIMGPNCNTFTAWLLALVPEAQLKLPWYAWGRNYKF